MKTYIAQINCNNCKMEVWTGSIPYGESVDDYLYNNKCKICGCYIIKAKRGRKRVDKDDED